MTAPQLKQMKYWIVKPKAAVNQIKNPAFASPDYEEDWTASGAGVTIAESGDYQRRGAYSMKVNPASGVESGAYYAGLTVEVGKPYTFSCYVKGTAGQAMRIEIRQTTTIKETKQFVATGYWQRVEVTYTAPVNAADYRVYVIRDAVASTDPFYVDGAQFEQDSKASTFFDGYTAGCHWTGAIRNSPSARSDNTGLGGELLCINDYAKIISVHGFGMGNWNQIMTKMTTGGDMYQTHIRTSRNVSMVLAYNGKDQGELQANRKVILDALRPDLLSNLPVREQFGINMPSAWRGHEQRIIRYQGFDENGNEATEPVDIVCVFQPSHADTPDTPVFQKDILNFTVPSGLFQGAYNEGKELDLYAEFPAEFIVKRDKDGNWCKWNGTSYDNLMKGQGTVQGLNGAVNCMAEGPDGKIYVGGNFTDAGGIAGADYLARWNPINEVWETVVAGISSSVMALAFDANGDLYIGGAFASLGSTDGNYIVKITGLEPGGSPTVNALGTGANNLVRTIAIAPDGDVYAGGDFTSAGGVANTIHIAKWTFDSGYTWAPLATGLISSVYALDFAPNGDLYIGGNFLNATIDGYGDYLCYWDGSEFNRVGTVELISGGFVRALAFGETGYLYVGGIFTNAGDIPNADYIAKWSGTQWESLGTGTNNYVWKLVVNSGKVYAAGEFTVAGGLTLTDRVAVWSNGAWQPLDVNLPGTATVRAILPASDGSLYIGGNFSTISAGENAKTGVVALNLNVTSASANTYPVISVTGPGTLKMITNYRTGKSVAFDGLTLQPGEWISLNFDPLNLSFRSGWDGRGNLMRYIIPGSDYGDFYVSPGANYISLWMDGTDANTRAGIVWRPKFWGLDGALLQ